LFFSQHQRWVLFFRRRYSGDCRFRSSPSHTFIFRSFSFLSQISQSRFLTLIERYPNFRRHPKSQIER
jgi:hypothetical protein